MRDLLRTGASGVLVLAIMVVGSLVLWVGVPAGWLWVGSQIQAETNDIGTALLVMFAGVVASVVALAFLLAWLNRRHVELRVARGLPRPKTSVLERVLVVTAAVAVVAFGIWFLVFAGPGPSLAPE
jgi:heme/copper-type cytochrome/quinol oxidase subunit 2